MIMLIFTIDPINLICNIINIVVYNIYILRLI